MGTNYYVIRAGEKKHLGIGRSAGRHFALHVYPDEGINRLEDWLVLLSDKKAEVRDDYGRKIKLKQVLRIILFTEAVHPKPEVSLHPHLQSSDYRYAIFPTYSHCRLDRGFGK